jgi:hypothetical protein
MGTYVLVKTSTTLMFIKFEAEAVRAIDTAPALQKLHGFISKILCGSGLATMLTPSFVCSKKFDLHLSRVGAARATSKCLHRAEIEAAYK